MVPKETCWPDDLIIVGLHIKYVDIHMYCYSWQLFPASALYIFTKWHIFLFFLYVRSLTLHTGCAAVADLAAPTSRGWESARSWPRLKQRTGHSSCEKNTEVLSQLYEALQNCRKINKAFNFLAWVQEPSYFIFSSVIDRYARFLLFLFSFVIPFSYSSWF